jgi:hypothetical protein
MWSMTMMRIWQNPFGERAADAPGSFETSSMFQVPRLEPRRLGASRLDAIGIRADRYLRSDVIDNPLPDTILDRLADLHWMERDPSLAI